MLGIKPRIFYMQNKHSTNEPVLTLFLPASARASRAFSAHDSVPMDTGKGPTKAWLPGGGENGIHPETVKGDRQAV